MGCAYGGACEGIARPFWIRSVGIPLCERHSARVRTVRETITRGADLRSLELLAAAAVMELASRIDVLVA